MRSNSKLFIYIPVLACVSVTLQVTEQDHTVQPHLVTQAQRAVLEQSRMCLAVEHPVLVIYILDAAQTAFPFLLRKSME